MGGTKIWISRPADSRDRWDFLKKNKREARGKYMRMRKPVKGRQK